MKEYVLTQAAPQIQYLTAADPRLGVLIKKIGDISYTLSSDPFSFLVNTIVGQMLSKKVSNAICARLTEKCGGAISTGAISCLDADDLRSIGLSNSKAKYILNLTEAAVLRKIDFGKLPELNDAEVIDALTSVRGIGFWSAKMYLIFTLGREDVLPYEDGAFLQSYEWMYGVKGERAKDIQKRCAVWKPYSTAAARYLYRALDDGLTKNPFSGV
jgi:DNA-3-methyladenine glycosylase II